MLPNWPCDEYGEGAQGHLTTPSTSPAHTCPTELLRHLASLGLEGGSLYLRSSTMAAQI